MRLLQVPLRDILEAPKAHRVRDIDPAFVRALADSFRAGSEQQSPIPVYGNGTYHAIGGNHQLAAMKLAFGEDSDRPVWVRVLAPKKDSDAILEAAKDNNHRDMTLGEWQGIFALAKSKFGTQDKIAVYFGVSQGFVSHALNADAFQEHRKERDAQKRILTVNNSSDLNSPSPPTQPGPDDPGLSFPSTETPLGGRENVGDGGSTASGRGLNRDMADRTGAGATNVAGSLPGRESRSQPYGGPTSMGEQTPSPKNPDIRAGSVSDIAHPASGSNGRGEAGSVGLHQPENGTPLSVPSASPAPPPSTEPSLLRRYDDAEAALRALLSRKSLREAPQDALRAIRTRSDMLAFDLSRLLTGELERRGAPDDVAEAKPARGTLVRYLMNGKEHEQPLVEAKGSGYRVGRGDRVFFVPKKDVLALVGARA